jgi:hypothetical protein
MLMVLRLRQIAIAARDLETPLAALSQKFGLKVGYIDPRVSHYGLRNVMLPMGCGFLEIVQPVRTDAAVARFLDRMGGDCGYMLILQTDDAVGEARRVADLGVRVVENVEARSYRYFHFHPSDFGGVLPSFDEVRVGGDPLEDFGEWPAAGREWRAARTDFVRDLVSVTLTAPDPRGLAARWSSFWGARSWGSFTSNSIAAGSCSRAAESAPGSRKSISGSPIRRASRSRRRDRGRAVSGGQVSNGAMSGSAFAIAR